MAAHQAAAPKRKRAASNIKITLPARCVPRLSPEAVQSDFADSADELAADPHARDQSDNGLPPVSALLEEPLAYVPHNPKKAKKQPVQHGDDDVDDLLMDSPSLTASDNLTTLASPGLSDTPLWPAKKPRKNTKAKPQVEEPKPENLSEHCKITPSTVGLRLTM